MQRLAGHEHRRWTNRDVKRQLDHRARRLLWTLVAGFVVAATPLALWQLQHYECLRLSHEAGELRAEGQRLGEEARRLRAEREALASLDSIESWAAKEGLERPTADRVVAVGEAPADGAQWLARNAERRGRD
jgi:hypothetical protein